MHGNCTPLPKAQSELNADSHVPNLLLRLVRSWRSRTDLVWNMHVFRSRPSLSSQANYWNNCRIELHHSHTTDFLCTCISTDAFPQTIAHCSPRRTRVPLSLIWQVPNCRNPRVLPLDLPPVKAAVFAPAWPDLPRRGGADRPRFRSCS